VKDYIMIKKEIQVEDCDGDKTKNVNDDAALEG
jgi:hypothetical protein